MWRGGDLRLWDFMVRKEDKDGEDVDGSGGWSTGAEEVGLRVHF